ncbi:NAD-dependent epimerase/dehydratase family protein [Ottowia thiooxydans]|uniref:NAD-dependent epimerase/dehydratase family protein n=1 Tax=Ottowia thiooxydans TaxID=219182 RepID=UPI00048E82F8|nr:NAD-dependent epimerase/dehydratase family protein [Ottowia thiooxydans]
MFRVKNFIVIGNGMIANEFVENADKGLSFCLYAAGVSNSQCRDAKEFERDAERLYEALQLIPKDLPLFYISTCSINDAPLPLSQYIAHKVRMEKMVLSRPNARIIRLTQVAGVSPNPHTLLNHIFNKIKNKESISVWRNSTRNLIDVKDVRRIVLDIIRDVPIEEIPSIVNVANTCEISIMELIDKFESVLGIPARREITDAGDEMKVNVDWIRPILVRGGINFDRGYIENMIRHYYAE